VLLWDGNGFAVRVTCIDYHYERPDGDTSLADTADVAGYIVVL